MYDDLSVMIVNNWQNDVKIRSLINYEKNLLIMIKKNALLYSKRSIVYVKYWMQMINRCQEISLMTANR
jgi:hypothetical protein